MSSRQKTVSAVIFIALTALLIAGIILIPAHERHETVKEVMKDAVLHESGKISLFGKEVNPGLISAFIVSAVLILFAVIVRIFVIPKFTQVPGKFQYLLETGVGFFSGMAKENSPRKHRFIGGYIFITGLYVFVSTIFELVGIQWTTVAGEPISLPAPLSDINGAIAMGLTSYGVIVFGGLICSGPKGMGNALKDFSLPISMSFRLYGALLSGALVTELVYYYTATSIVIPVVVGVLFTLLHAVIQAYVLTMLVSIFFGESTEHDPKKKKTKEEDK